MNWKLKVFFFSSLAISRRTYFMWWTAIVSFWQVTMSQLLIEWRFILSKLSNWSVVTALFVEIIIVPIEMLKINQKHAFRCKFLTHFQWNFHFVSFLFALSHATPSIWQCDKRPNPYSLAIYLMDYLIIVDISNKIGTQRHAPSFFDVASTILAYEFVKSKQTECQCVCSFSHWYHKFSSKNYFALCIYQSRDYSSSTK